MGKVIGIIIVVVLLAGGFYLATHKSALHQLLGQTAQVMPTPTQTVAMHSTGTHQYPHPSGGAGRGHFGNMPSGSIPIFGQVTAVNGSTLTVQRQSRNGSGTTITIDLTSSTQYTGGSQSSIQTGTRIGGYGTTNSDGSINAEQIMINPTFPGRGQNGNQ